MSLARAFTKKRAKKEEAAESLGRSLTTTKVPIGSVRDKISSPLELLSTTNMLSYNAPDIHTVACSPTSSSNISPASESSSDSDHKSISSDSTPPSSPDTEKGPPQPNHLTCYFNSGPSLSAARSSPDLTGAPSAPKIPARAPSHTKNGGSDARKHKASAPAMGSTRSSLQMFESLRAMSQSSTTSTNSSRASSMRKHSMTPSSIPEECSEPPSSSISTAPLMENAATTTQNPATAPERQPTRSRPLVQGLPSGPNQIDPPTSRSRSRSRSHHHNNNNNIAAQTPHQHSNPSADPPKSQRSFSPRQMSPHPFGNELAQVNELAEEFVRDRQEADDAEDARVMAEKGLSSFGAEGYMVEIQELFCMAFGGGTTVGGKEGKMEGVGGSAMWI